ncbi:MAG: aryl-sulfate sulfotransferase [Phycisphaerales bacterium]|nr:aryl-sulfate sulfotransferase [Phycisphaerales bacterium]
MFLRLMQVLFVLQVVIPSAGVVAQGLVPPSGAELQTTIAHLKWMAVPQADQYELQIGLAGGSGDPFTSPLYSEITSSTSAVIDEGLEFGDALIWRTRAYLNGVPDNWSEVSEFSIRTIPVGFPILVEANFGVSDPAMGLTLFNHCQSIVGYDLNGELQLLVDTPARVSDARIISDGRLLCVGGGQAAMLDLMGQVIWKSPDSDDFRVHHCASETPWGGVLMVVRDYREVTQDGVSRTWQGDRIVEMNPVTNEIVFDWSTFDHFSTDDYDVFQTNHWNDWTHINDAHIEPSDGRIWISVRHLSRITAIDYDTGEIAFNIGMELPSGDVTVGDDLFSYQHSPMLLENGNLLLFDNGNRRGGEPVGADGYSRAVEIALEGDPPVSAKVVWSWETPIYCPSTGDADRLANGNTLVTSTQLSGMYEVDPKGNEVWHLDILNYETCPGLRPGYRADRVPDIYFSLEECIGDIDASGVVGVDDLLTLIAHWGGSGLGDVDESGTVGVDDLLIVLNAWGDC